MSKIEDLTNVCAPQCGTHLSEKEVADLIQEAAQQYEECMRLADLADISSRDETSSPRYAWDNPIGLVVTGNSNARLV